MPVSNTGLVAIALELQKDVLFQKRREDRPDWACLRMAHEIWSEGSIWRTSVQAHTVMLVLAGDGSWSLGDDSGRLVPGQLIIYGPTDFMGFNIHQKFEMRLLCIHPQDGNRELTACGLPTSGVVTLPDHLAIASILTEGLSAACGPSPRRQEIANLYMRLALVSMAGQLSNPAQGNTGFQTYLAAREYIDKNSTAGGAQEVASVIGVTPEHLSRLFRRYAGMPIFAWIRRTRVQRACHQLLNSDKTLAEIASEVGYADGFTFAKAFRSVVGQSPGQWRTIERERLSRPKIESAQE